MMQELRRLASEKAQADFAAALADSIANGTWNAGLLAKYNAAEGILDAIDYYEESLQRTDPEAPDYFASMLAGGYVSESEMRLMDGNR